MSNRSVGPLYRHLLIPRLRPVLRTVRILYNRAPSYPDLPKGSRAHLFLRSKEHISVASGSRDQIAIRNGGAYHNSSRASSSKVLLLRRLPLKSLINPSTDRVVQATVVLIMEPIFEADFEDCSYGHQVWAQCAPSLGTNRRSTKSRQDRDPVSLIKRLCFSLEKLRALERKQDDIHRSAGLVGH